MSAEGRAGTRSSREVILDVAEHLMTTKGYGGASIAAIRRESGLPVGSIYHHFSSKAGILSAVLQRWSDRFFADLSPFFAVPGDADERFRAYWQGATDQIIDQGPMFLLEVDLLRLSHDDPELAVVMAQVCAATRRGLEPTFVAFAAERGAPDSEGLGRRLAALTESATRGLVVTAGPDVEELRRSMDDLYLAVRSAVTVAASS